MLRSFYLNDVVPHYFKADAPQDVKLECDICAHDAEKRGSKYLPLISIDGVPCETETMLRLTEKAYKQLVAALERED